MVRSLYIFVNISLYGLLVSASAAQDFQWTQTAGPEGGAISALVNHGGMIYAGTHGGVYRYGVEQDRWTRWGLEDQLVYELVSASDDLLFAVANGELYFQAGNALAWRHLDTPFGQIFSFAPKGGGELYAGSYDGIWYSTDTGASWSHIGPDTGGSAVTEIEVTSSGAILASNGGTLYRSTDGGITWSTSWGHFVDIYSGRDVIYGAWATNAGACPGAVYISKDDGVTWSKTSLACPDVLKVIEAEDAAYAGTSEGLFRSADFGETWTSWGLDRKTIRALATSEDRLFAGSGSEGAYLSPLDRADWTRHVQGIVQSRVWKVTMDRFGRLFATTVGSFAHPGTVCQSSDRGDAWICSSDGMANHSAVFDVEAFTHDSIFAATYEGVYRSVDGGRSWELKSAGLEWQGAQVFDLLLLTSGRLFAAESEGVFTSDDLGETWQRREPSGAGILAVHNDTVYVAGSRLHLSADSGETWTSVLEGKLITAFAIDPSSGTLFAGIHNEDIIRSTDRGRRWQSVGLKEQGFVYSLAVNDDGDVFASTRFGGVSVSRNGGENWNSLGFGFAEVYSMTFDDEGFLYAGVRNHGVYRSSRTTLVSIDRKELVPAGSVLRAPYPNPMNEATILNYSLSTTANTTIKVYDLLGRPIAIVVNGIQPAGEHRVTWDGRDDEGNSLSSGVYLIHFEVDGRRETRTIVLRR